MPGKRLSCQPILAHWRARGGGQPRECSISNKRIYVVVPGGTRSVGGMCRFADYFSRAWRARGYRPELVILDSFGPDSRWKMPFYFLAAFVRVLVDGLGGRIALLHVNMAERASVVRKGALVYAARWLGIPVVIHLHAAEFEGFADGLPGFLRRRLVALFNAADAVIVLGSPWYTYVTRNLGVDATRVHVLRNAVPGPAGIADRSGPGPCRFLFLGVLSERKGMKELVPALAVLAQTPAPWHIDIAGNGDVDDYRAWTDRLGLSSKVTFHGWVDEAAGRSLLAASDVLVLPSRNEGLPLAILEGMAYGLAIIATPVGAIRDAVADGENGIIIPPKDVEALTGALRRLAEDADLRRTMGAASRARFLDEFEIGALTERLKHLFDGLIAGPKPRRGRR